ncbi:VOC family protein [Mucilaginibacter jinjuensis]|uniref:VOC family protein n=1 Tax=Mucilaginibacter jinjuensis TaxID=1176721 RepID=A0ABY7T2R2_9SPHI|nr:VOC family protein [Mucilaginibacter jinjuensis]WCT10584.1 VOC family protein [Mucilaginibacter jinjuensis]
MQPTNKITPFFWFNDTLDEALEFYASVFKNFEIKSRDTNNGKTFIAIIVIEGQELMTLNWGSEFQFNPAVSLFIKCKTQEEVDYYWDSLLANGGRESQCGWLQDKFGLSWQVVPEILGELMGNPDREKANRVMQAMMKMVKLDVAALKKAAE